MNLPPKINEFRIHYSRASAFPSSRILSRNPLIVFCNIQGKHKQLACTKQFVAANQLFPRTKFSPLRDTRAHYVLEARHPRYLRMNIQPPGFEFIAYVMRQGKLSKQEDLIKIHCSHSKCSLLYYFSPSNKSSRAITSHLLTYFHLLCCLLLIPQFICLRVTSYSFIRVPMHSY